MCVGEASHRMCRLLCGSTMDQQVIDLSSYGQTMTNFSLWHFLFWVMSSFEFYYYKNRATVWGEIKFKVQRSRPRCSPQSWSLYCIESQMQVQQKTCRPNKDRNPSTNISTEKQRPKPTGLHRKQIKNLTNCKASMLYTFSHGIRLFFCHRKLWSNNLE